MATSMIARGTRSSAGETGSAIAPGAPAKPAITIQRPAAGGRYIDIIWDKWSGVDATSWQLLEDGQVIHSAAVAPGAGKAQSGSFRVTGRSYGVYIYQVVLLNGAGRSLSDQRSYAAGGASPIVLGGPGVDAGRQSLQMTIDEGANDFSISIFGLANPFFMVDTNNRSVIECELAGKSTLRIRGLQPGRASLRLSEDTTGAVRYIGVRVRAAGEQRPGMPGYLAIGSISEDNDADLSFWRSFSANLTNKRIDLRYHYVHGGPYSGWRSWGSFEGSRAVNFIRESKKLGVIPFFIYYNLQENQESYQDGRQHAESASYMEAYFKDLRFFLEIVRAEGEDELVGIILEPNFIGYNMQNSGGRSPIPLDQIQARTDAAYSCGVLDRQSDPAFPNSIKGMIEAINYTISKYAPNASFGWQFNLWASPGVTVDVPPSGLIRLTDSLGLEPGRAAIEREAAAIADYYLSGGVGSYGANFIALDRYGLDAGASSPESPAASTWFWNADHWNTYLRFTRVLSQRAGLPMVLWQIPVGHIDESMAANPYGARPFPALKNQSRQYEDSATTFFFGDSFRPGSPTRLAYFSANQGGDPLVSVEGETVRWGAHLREAAAHGVIAILFGAGVDYGTAGVGSPPSDGYWWISQVQRYYERPVSMDDPSTDT